MKKVLYVVLSLLLAQGVFAATAFESSENAIEIKLEPAITTAKAPSLVLKKAEETPLVNTSYKTTIKQEKFNSAINNLDDALVELRQELADSTAKYNEALKEKEKAVANCKALKNDVKALNRKMNSIEKSKRIISKNLEQEK